MSEFSPIAVARKRKDVMLLRMGFGKEGKLLMLQRMLNRQMMCCRQGQSAVHYSLYVCYFTYLLVLLCIIHTLSSLHPLSTPCCFFPDVRELVFQDCPAICPQL